MTVTLSAPILTDPLEDPQDTVELFRESPVEYERQVVGRDSTRTYSTIPSVTLSPIPTASLVDQAEGAWLRSTQRPPAGNGKAVRAIDLFSGCGGLTIGLEEAARALGRRFEPALAIDSSADAANVYAKNYPFAHTITGDVTHVLDSAPGANLSFSERTLARRHEGIDILVGGPPCQGHSDLNNRTRRNDTKNALYGSMVRAAEVFQPEHILVENVPGAIHDKQAIVQRTAESLTKLGYEVSLGVVDLSKLGVAQKRKRLVLAASRTGAIDFARLQKRHGRGERDLRWAIEDLEDTPSSAASRLVDHSARSAPATVRRMRYLFEHGLYELPDSERPPCHSGGGHTYSSIYGRLRWDRPAQTITRGFYSMCMGRYVHPSRERTLTAHEAARLQHVPDWFDFTPAPSRSSLATMIGNMVPSRLSYALALEWLR